MLKLTHQIITLILFTLAFLSQNSFSQTLISKLPSDGIAATYQYRFSNPDRPEHGNAGILTLRCVGTEKIDGTKLRWVEVEFQYKVSGTEELKDGKTVEKFLVDENDLGNGKSLQENAKKIWAVNTKFKQSTEPSDSGSGHMLDYYQPKYTESKALPAKEIKVFGADCKCNGTQYSTTASRNGLKGQKGTIRKYSVYSNDKSPFGSVELKIDISGPDGEKRTAQYQLDTIKMNAKPFIKKTL